MTTATATTTLPSRLWAYLREMYPPQVYVPFSFAGFFGFYFLLQAASGAPVLMVSWRAIAGAVTLTLFSLLMRLFDEMKDAEVDKTLFPHRPLPSGKVRLGDLQGLAWGVGAAMVALNAAMGAPAIAGFALMAIYGLLTFRYFFVPHLHKDNLLLTVATHNPVVVFCNLYVWGVFLAERGEAFRAPPGWVWAAIAMYWLPVLAWEFSRKIKAPEEENAYLTYSRILGARRAAAVPMIALTASAALAGGFAMQLGLSPVAIGAVALCHAAAMFGFFRFLGAVTPAHSRLKPFAEAFSLGLYMALLVGMIARYGVAWGG